MLDLGPKTPNNEGHSCSIDLSRDGRTLYLSLLPIETDTTVTHRIGRLGLPADLALPDASPEPQAIYEAPPSPLPGQDVPYSGVTWDPSVDDDSTYLYLVRRGVDTIDELVRACGHGLPWADGMLLGNGFDSRGRATGSILSIDPRHGRCPHTRDRPPSSGPLNSADEQGTRTADHLQLAQPSPVAAGGGVTAVLRTLIPMGRPLGVCSRRRNAR